MFVAGGAYRARHGAAAAAGRTARDGRGQCVGVGAQLGVCDERDVPAVQVVQRLQEEERHGFGVEVLLELHVAMGGLDDAMVV